MYILNTSFVVPHGDQTSWLRLVTEDYIPLLRENGFNDITLTRVLTNEACDHFTYSLMVGLDSISGYEHITGQLFQQYINTAEALFEDCPLWFTTLLKKI